MNAVDRRWLWLVDYSPHALGLAGLLLGVTVTPALLPLGRVALGVALFAWLAEAEGFALPRPGRRPIVMTRSGHGGVNASDCVLST